MGRTLNDQRDSPTRGGDRKPRVRLVFLMPMFISIAFGCALLGLLVVHAVHRATGPVKNSAIGPTERGISQPSSGADLAAYPPPDSNPSPAYAANDWEFPPLPDFPDRGQPGFDLEVREQRGYIEESLELLDSVLNTHQTALNGVLLLVERFSHTSLAEENRPERHARLESILRTIQAGDFGDSTKAAQRHATEALGLLRKYKRFQNASRQYKERLAALANVKSTRGDAETAKIPDQKFTDSHKAHTQP